MRINKLDPASSPLATFGWQLRELRNRARLSQDELGYMVNYTGAYISMIENGKRVPPSSFVRAADKALDAVGTLESTWYLLGHTSLVEGFPEYIVLEAKARLIRLFKAGLVPGLVQTEEYASAVEAGYVARGSITAEQAEERVRVVMVRQAPLEQPDGPRLHVVLDESCLRTVIGDPQVMARQLDHLLALAEHPKVVLQVMPFERGALRPFTHFMGLLAMPDRELLGYTETPQRGYLTRDPDTVTTWNTDYDLFQVEALSQADSVATIRKLRRGFQHGDQPQRRGTARRRVAQVQLQRGRRGVR
ncbi:helix-turn-helix domain-containing protein [Kitasatospora sp. NA04385]|uniref:helix-turn-helix domain-containing protein n=1 Tax=Kitasatospora sp. NA04385 TaxID=2742135 RepID=UPI00159046B3|nr:helix-turn-helix transcriptional regulator [Kitasatospora sp. NA04385]QKW22484.1 helix-turn-helix domain-containing protein [Kitasatospora sp. NA04385]